MICSTITQSYKNVGCSKTFSSKVKIELNDIRFSRLRKFPGFS
jgi:hypothetical protein